jgi:DNA-binding NarL/FixJ family response regulator
MISYNSFHQVLNKPGTETTASPEVPDPSAGGSEATQVALPEQTSSDGNVLLISIIDPRMLVRDTLARAFGAANSRFRPHAFAHLDEWLRDDGIREKTAAILLVVGATDAGDPGLANDIGGLARDFPHVPTVVMGDIEDPSYIVSILSYGARGYIPTSVSLSIAAGAIALAHAGGVFVPASSLLQSQQIASEPAQAGRSLRPLLTARQAAIAEAVVCGKQNKVIAHELNLCESTVKVHVRSLMKKLQARNRTEVAFKLHSLRRAGPKPPEFRYRS